MRAHIKAVEPPITAGSTASEQVAEQGAHGKSLCCCVQLSTPFHIPLALAQLNAPQSGDRLNVAAEQTAQGRSIYDSTYLMPCYVALHTL